MPYLTIEVVDPLPGAHAHYIMISNKFKQSQEHYWYGTAKIK